MTFMGFMYKVRTSVTYGKPEDVQGKVGTES
jgi:hypothetical protein